MALAVDEFLEVAWFWNDAHLGEEVEEGEELSDEDDLEFAPWDKEALRKARG